MRFLCCLIAIAAAAACTTKPTEGVCCVTEADCARLGVDAPRSCEVGQACKAFECVAAECASSAECASPDAPVCVDSLCVEACRTDDNCVGAAGGPICADDGACVGCLGDADCPASAPFCDAEDRRCRGCELDAECASGVCIEADAACAEPSEIIYVQMSGNDVGDCTNATPCGTLPYALQKVTATRKVIRISGGSLQTAPATITIDRPVVLDGSGTSLSKAANVPLFSIGMSAGVVTFEGLVVFGSSDPSEPTITVASGSSLRVTESVFNTASIDVANGSLDLRDVSLATSLVAMQAVKCSSGTVSARTADFEHTSIGATNCQLNVSRCRFDERSAGALSAQGGVAIIENNLVIQSDELADTMSLTNMAPGSTVRFNTFVNTSGVASSGVALYCDGTPDVTSNIFAYGSAYPMGPPLFRCPATLSLFDTVAVPEQSMGQGNIVADAATFFVSPVARDFHLSAASPAKGMAAPGTSVTEDFEGNPRPAPVGSTADVGCFEAR